MDIRWTQIESWHIIESTFVSRASRPMVTTLCGITQGWDQTFVDSLPGGSEKSCENCLIALAGDVDETPAPKKSRKKKQQ